MARSLRNGVSTGLKLLDFLSVADLSCRVADQARPKAVGDRWKTFRDIPRIDLKERLVGTPFVHDVTAPDMLHGAPVHPPNMHSALVSLDLDALKARPGVVEVVHDGSFVGVVAERTACCGGRRRMGSEERHVGSRRMLT